MEGSTVGDALQRLVGQFGDLRRHLYNDDGKLRSFVNIYVNDEDIRHLDREQTTLKAGDTISIVPSVAGGSGAAVDAPELSREEVQRYSRHLIMPEVGLDGQRKLKAARVLCVGAGGLGAPAAMYLAAAGVGTLGLVDFDVVDASNLHRQIIYGTPDVGKRKLDAARERLNAMNSAVKVVTHELALTSKNALDVFKDYDIILDGTDNFQTRYLVNDACVLLGKPNAYGSIFRFDGQASVFGVKGGPCYRCLYPERAVRAGPELLRGGVLGVLPGVSHHPGDRAIKLILGTGQPRVRPVAAVRPPCRCVSGTEAASGSECPSAASSDDPRMIDYDHSAVSCPRTPNPPAVDGSEVTAEDLKRNSIVGADAFVLTSASPRVSDLPNRGIALIPLGELARRTGSSIAIGNDRALQDGRPQRKGGGVAAGTRIHARAHNLRWHPRLDRPCRPSRSKY